MRPSQRFFALITGIGILASLALGPAAAALGPAGQGTGSWTLRGFGAWVNTTGDRVPFGPSIDPLPPVIDASVAVDDGTGLGLALEYRATRRLGVELLAIRADLDASFRLLQIDPPGPPLEQTEDLSTDLLGLSLNIHLTPGRRVDVYAGPLIALVRYGEVTANIADGEYIVLAELEDDEALGVTLGMDVALGRSGAWALTTSLRQLWSTTELAQSGRKLDVDPLIASAGIAYRWGGR